jgi:hypothetical protein
VPNHCTLNSLKTSLLALNLAALFTIIFTLTPARADETGVGFWVPGFFGSLAATPQAPGFSFANVFIAPTVNGGGNIVFARQVTRGDLTANFNSNLRATLDGHADLSLAVPSYTLPSPIFGAQANFAVAIPYGGSFAGVSAALNGSIGSRQFSVSGATSDSVTGFGDLAPMFSLRWNAGVNNYLAYVTNNIPIGLYDADNLVNLGIGHAATDAGGGYTYFNPETGNEFSGVLGFTYNFENPSTLYQNGVDMHFDWGASHFFTKQLQIGAVGYDYQQISCDSGAGNRLGCFESHVLGAGAQVGYIIPMGKLQGYVNLKAYKEFAAENRAYGWNAWLTFAISEATPTPTTPSY